MVDKINKLVYNCTNINNTVQTKKEKGVIYSMDGKKFSPDFKTIKRDVFRHWPIWVSAGVVYLLSVLPMLLKGPLSGVFMLWNP